MTTRKSLALAAIMLSALPPVRSRNTGTDVTEPSDGPHPEHRTPSRSAARDGAEIVISRGGPPANETRQVRRARERLEAKRVERARVEGNAFRRVRGI